MAWRDHRKPKWVETRLPHLLEQDIAIRFISVEPDIPPERVRLKTLSDSDFREQALQYLEFSIACTQEHFR